MVEQREGRPEAAALIWSWQDAQGLTAAPPAESPARARQRGALRATFALGIGGLLFAFWSQIIGTIVLAIGSVLLVSALFSPLGLYATIERLFGALGQATGRALAWILLVPIFYLFFLPFGRLLRRGRRDRMQRFYDPEAGSYWEPRDAGAASSRRRLY